MTKYFENKGTYLQNASGSVRPASGKIGGKIWLAETARRSIAPSSPTKLLEFTRICRFGVWGGFID
jgi:hypothetical protein